MCAPVLLLCMCVHVHVYDDVGSWLELYAWCSDCPSLRCRASGEFGDDPSGLRPVSPSDQARPAWRCSSAEWDVHAERRARGGFHKNRYGKGGSEGAKRVQHDYSPGHKRWSLYVANLRSCIRHKNERLQPSDIDRTTSIMG